jgi:hypothetical protein
MEIMTQNMKTPTECSIESVRVIKETFGADVYSYLSVSLKNKLQSRARFEGSSFEARKPVYKLKIELDELQEMVGALTHELDLCHRVLHAKGLLHDIESIVEELKTKKQETYKRKPFSFPRPPAFSSPRSAT